MFVDRSTDTITLQPMPGEIWAVNNDASFDEGADSVRYLMVIKEARVLASKLVSVMVLSEDIRSLSDKNILIPPEISGLRVQVLAQTANIGKISIEHLQFKIGNRLSRQIYDLLLSIGDGDRGVVTNPPFQQEIASLGLQITTEIDRENRSSIQKFDLHERAWLLSFQPAKIDRIAKLMAEAIAGERAAKAIAQQIDLSKWFQQVFPPQWQAATNYHLDRRVLVRRTIERENIAALLVELQSSDDLAICRQLITKLNGAIRSSNPTQIISIPELVTTLVETIDRTPDNETFWQAIECLQQLQPHHPRAGIRRARSIDLGKEMTLLMNIVARKDDKIGILLQIHPSAPADYLPLDLKFFLQDEADAIPIELVATAHDYCLQIEFSGAVGEIFKLGLELAEYRSIEQFII
jgi:Protein of unknown function (DUF1822)